MNPYCGSKTYPTAADDPRQACSATEAASPRDRKAECEPAPAVQASLSVQSRMLDGLGELLRRVEDRLGPVLAPEPSEPSCPGDKCEDGPPSQLRVLIDTHNIQIDGLCRRLSGLLVRLEV